MAIDTKTLSRLYGLAANVALSPAEVVEVARALPALLAEREQREALLSALKAERFDPQRNEVTICGVRYAIKLFEHLGAAPVGEWVRIEKREGETLTLRRAAAPDWPSERKEMLALLREVEWNGDPGVDWETGWASCPCCEGLRPADAEDRRRVVECWATDNHVTMGHASGCRLAALLGGG